MTVIREGNLEFDFGQSWKAIKYDENGSFYSTLMKNKMEPTKAVDFLSLHTSSGPLLMIEAKDFTPGVPSRERFDAIPMAIALKVRDTVAGIIGGSNCAANSQECGFFKDCYKKLSVSPRVIYFFEDLPTAARMLPQRKANKKDVLLKKLKEHLRWLTRDIAVVGLDDYSQFIEDLSIRRIS